MAKESKRYMSWINIPLDKSINAMSDFVKVASEMNKRRQNRSLRLIALLLALIAGFLLLMFWGFGFFILSS